MEAMTVTTNSANTVQTVCCLDALFGYNET